MSYLAATTGASIDQTSNALHRHGPFKVADTAPLETKITGLLHGQPWRTHVGYSEALILAMRLATACLVVVA